MSNNVPELQLKSLNERRLEIVRLQYKLQLANAQFQVELLELIVGAGGKPGWELDEETGEVRPPGKKP